MSKTTTKAASPLPLLNIQDYYTNPSQFVQELQSVCHSVGFFLLQYDIPTDIAQQQLDETRQFFQRPLHDKLKISYEHSPSFRGYMRIGVENTAGAVDIREQIEYAATYPRSNSSQKGRNSSWPVYERLKDDTNPWPHTLQPTLQHATEAYVSHARRIADCLRQALCVALGQEHDVMDPLFGSDNNSPSTTGDDIPHWVLKLINYPKIDDKIRNDMQTAASFGVGGHTDTNFLTLVLQDDVGGLQVYTQGEWVDVPSHHGPDVLVCNLGEQAQILSRGYFLATPHRVLANLSGSRDRVSVPLFYNPMLRATIKPIIGDNNNRHLQWDRQDDYQHWQRKSNAMLATVGDNTFKSLARSHPKVFQKHHSDLILNEDGSIVQKS